MAVPPIAAPAVPAIMASMEGVEAGMAVAEMHGVAVMTGTVMTATVVAPSVAVTASHKSKQP
jgi:hypothetical protein